MEHRENARAGFLAMQAVDHVNSESVRSFRRRLGDDLRVRTDALPTYGILGLEQGLTVESRVTPPDKVDEWLPIVPTAIANLKRFLLGTYHGVSGPKLQKYLDEFVYRYNRRFWESQLPDRLLKVCASHQLMTAKYLYN